jgi:hypothetical protein
MDSERLLQALTRFGRTLGAAAVAAGLLAIGDLVADLQLGPTIGPIVLLSLTAVLNAIGKFIRGPSLTGDPTVLGVTRPQRSWTRLLPI